MRDDIMAVKNEVENIKKEEKGLAMELLADMKHQNKRQFIIILVILTMWFITIGYLVYLLNDIGVMETSDIEVQDVETINKSNIQIGDR